MKTQIIQLEPHDDIISARDKMGWGQTSRILLIWPDSGQVLNRRLDLILLQRHTASLGAQLAIVTRDQNVRFYANKLAIPVFKNIHLAQDSSWRVKNRRRSTRSINTIKAKHESPDLNTFYANTHPTTPDWLRYPVTRLSLFIIGVLAVMSIGAILLPASTVKLNVKKETQEITLNVIANPEIENINLSGELPAYRTQVIVEGRSTLPVQGTIQIPYEYAVGRVTFTNLTDESIYIPINTVVRTLDSEPIRFLITKEIEVPAGPGESTSASVTAVKPGESGNLPANRLVAIEGPLGLTLSVSNPLPTNGGKDRIAPAANEEDREKLFQQMLDDLELTAISELREQIRIDDILFTSTLSITEVLEETYEPTEGMPSDNLTLNLRVGFEALTVSSEDIETLLTNILDANLMEGTSPYKETLEYSNLKDPETNDEGIARWQINAIRSFKVHIPEEQVFNIIKGQTPTMARQLLIELFPLNDPPELAISPNWWPRIPLLPFRVQVIQE